MKKMMVLLIALMLLFLCTACGCEHEYDAGQITKEASCIEEGIKTFTCSKCGNTKEEAIPCIPHRYEEKITKDPTFVSVGEKTFTCTMCGDSYTEEIPMLEKTVFVTVTDKKNIAKDTDAWIFSDYVNLIFNLKNMTDKDVKGVSGRLHVSDLFGKEFLISNCDFTGITVPAGKSITVTDLSLEINQFMDNQKKLFNEDFADLVFDYELTQVVYTDGTKDVFQ